MWESVERGGEKGEAGRREPGVAKSNKRRLPSTSTEMCHDQLKGGE